MRPKLTRRMQQIARQHLPKADCGPEKIYPFRQLLLETINQEASLTLAADQLGIDISTLSRWCIELDIEVITNRRVSTHTRARLRG